MFSIALIKYFVYLKTLILLHVDASELTDIILSQDNVGSTAKVSEHLQILHPILRNFKLINYFLLHTK